MSPTLKRIVIGAGVTALVLAVLVVAMFAFGKPTIQQAPSSAAAPEGAASGAPAGSSDPLAVEVPGCVCHSDDPQVVEAHATYRMSQCFDCHRDGMPEMSE